MVSSLTFLLLPITNHPTSLLYVILVPCSTMVEHGDLFAVPKIGKVASQFQKTINTYQL